MYAKARDPRRAGPSSGEERRKAPGDVLAAWLWVLALPIASFAAFMVFSGVTSWMGYDIWNDASPPFWPGIVAEVPTLLVFSVPAIFSTRNARRAARVGDRRGWVPAGILLTITGYYLVTMMVAPLLG